ncbi:WbuC family cupin fold metalloprotein [uncultured Bacteroides sp.]|uniref:WbuC family cupin fold metalloprotein n=1 Tax=uncultured Bacteroides sp. TaxID=162156 RepID=UPI002631F67F|nr:WbuC family cupin fold metalloprotein [uncultured Bacteroides sp.]
MLLTQDIINSVSNLAKESHRLRMNYNLHESFEDSVQRMFNAIEPGSEIPIARHLKSNETLILLQGKLKVFIFNDKKEIIEEVILDRNIGNIGYHIPKGVWHSVKSLETGTVLFETREGPYIPVSDDDILK